MSRPTTSATPPTGGLTSSASVPARLLLAIVVAVTMLAIDTRNDVHAARTWHVAPWGDDRAAGDVDRPYRTVTQAVRRASSGDTIELRGGTYRESVQVFRKGLTIRSRDGERAVFDGAVPLDGFRSEAGRWYVGGWTTQYYREPSGGPVAAARQIAGYPDQVFFNGRPLRQVLSLAEVGAGTFFHDTAADRIWLGDDPRGHQVEASRYRWAFYLNQADGSRLENITVRRFATEARHMAAIRAYSDDVVIQGVDVHLNARMGLSAIGNRIFVRDSRFVDNGYIGVHGDRVDTFVVERTAILGNNKEGFDPFHSAAGMKVTSSRGITVRESDVSRNDGPGIWTDLDTRFVTLVRNLVESNGRAGVEIELSSDVNVLSNVALGNGEAGIWILESQNVQVLHNASFENKNEIEVEEGPRREVRNVRIMNNAMGDAREGSRAVLDVNDWTAERSAAQMGVSVDFNAYWLPPSAGSENLSRWGEGPNGIRWSTDLDQHRRLTGQDLSSVWSVDSSNPFARQPGQLDFRSPDSLRRGAPVTGSAADDLGMSSGDRRRIGPVAPVARR